MAREVQKRNGEVQPGAEEHKQIMVGLSMVKKIIILC